MTLGVEKWATIFISMILEALPFILIGAIISAAIQMYISE
ncbi:permease, partial [Clostridium perfringens]|nr:permease [Clostridium perfringens]